MTDLLRGGNAELPIVPLTVSVVGAAPGSVDLMVLSLGDGRRVRSDDELVFFNQPTSPDGAVRLVGPGQITVALPGVAAETAELVVAVALDDAVPGSLATVSGLAVRVAGADVEISAAAAGLTTERAAALVELYRRGEGWKVRNVSAGWDAGLPSLLREFGVSVDEDTAAAPTPAAVEPVTPPAPSTPPAPHGSVDLGKRTGRVDLVKGQRVSIEKSALIVASIQWPPDTDYDVYALIRYTDGRTETVATFGTADDPTCTLTSSDGAVRHLGDVQRRASGRQPGESRKDRKAREARESTSALAQERIEIRPRPDMAAVVPVAYSAQSNGTGSFRRYRVSMAIDNGRGTVVQIDAANADDNDAVFTCVPGIIRVDGADVTIDAVELYSAPYSENRPVLGPDLQVIMDAGPENDFK